MFRLHVYTVCAALILHLLYVLASRCASHDDLPGSREGAMNGARGVFSSSWRSE